MNNRGYPKDLVLTKDDFDEKEFHEVLSRAERHLHMYMHSELMNAAQSYIQKGNIRKGKMYWILQDACSMMLTPGNLDEPFQPFMIWEGMRSAMPEDFTEGDISFFTEIVPSVNDPLMKARLADLVWFKSGKYDCALTAIDSYIEIPITDEKWFGGEGSDYWHRAVVLAKKLGKSALDRQLKIEEQMIDAIINVDDGRKGAAHAVANLMLHHRLGRNQAESIANALENMANQARKDNVYFAESLYNLAAEWHKISNNEEKEVEMLWHKAESILEKVKINSGDAGQGILLIKLCEEAIHALNEIPASHREVYEVDKHLQEMRQLKNKAGQIALDQMIRVESPPIDISGQVEQARNFVSGKKTAQEALSALARIAPFASASKMEKDSVEQIQKHPLPAFFGSSVLADDGRVVSKARGISPSAPLDKETPKVSYEIMQVYSHFCQFVVESSIMPALGVIKNEHRIEEEKFLEIAAKSPIVPPDRERSFAQGIYSGYDHSFVSALHTLIPQFENAIRFLLKAKGANTLHMDREGIETEKGLGTLIHFPEMEKTFSEDIIFEIEALFLDKNGPNLRNELMHGLSAEDVCNSYFGIYAWWFIFRLVFISHEKYENE